MGRLHGTEGLSRKQAGFSHERSRARREMVLSSGQISFMGEATLAVSSRKTALFHTEPNILALRKTVVCALDHD